MFFTPKSGFHDALPPLKFSGQNTPVCMTPRRLEESCTVRYPGPESHVTRLINVSMRSDD